MPNDSASPTNAANNTNTATEQPPAETDNDNGHQGMRNPPHMNTTNLKTNEVFGHDMALPKPENTTRLTSLNVNGVRRGDDYQDVLELGQAFKTTSSDLMTLAETNMDWRSMAKHKNFTRKCNAYTIRSRLAPRAVPSSTTRSISLEER
jgi:hypothetical protein